MKMSKDVLPVVGIVVVRNGFRSRGYGVSGSGPGTPSALADGVSTAPCRRRSCPCRVSVGRFGHGVLVGDQHLHRAEPASVVTIRRRSPRRIGIGGRHVLEQPGGLIQRCPNTGSHACHDGCACQRGGFMARMDRQAEDVGQKPNEVARRGQPAVDPQGARAFARARHGVEQRADLVADGFQACMSDVASRCRLVQSDNGGADVRPPPRRSQALQCRNQQKTRAVSRVGRALMELGLPSGDREAPDQPVERVSAAGGKSLFRVAGAVQLPCHRADDARSRRPSWFGADVAPDETAGSDGHLHVLGAQAAVAQQRRLLVAEHANERDRPAKERGGDLPERGIRAAAFREVRDLQAEQPEQLVVPGHPVDVEQHGAGCVARIRRIGLARRELPHQPGVHRPEQQASGFQSLRDGGGVMKQPLQFRCGECGVEPQSRARGDVGLVWRQGFDFPAPTAALPHHRGDGGSAGLPIPHHERFGLVAEAKPDDVLGPRACRLHDLADAGDDVVEHGLRALLHAAARRRTDRDGPLRVRQAAAIGINGDRLRKRRALVDPDQNDALLLHACCTHPAACSDRTSRVCRSRRAKDALDLAGDRRVAGEGPLENGASDRKAPDAELADLRYPLDA